MTIAPPIVNQVSLTVETTFVTVLSTPSRSAATFCEMRSSDGTSWNTVMRALPIPSRSPNITSAGRTARSNTDRSTSWTVGRAAHVFAMGRLAITPAPSSLAVGD